MAATRSKSLFLAYGEHTFSFADLLISDSSVISNETVGKFVQGIRKGIPRVKTSTENSNDKSSVSYSKNRPEVDFNVGDSVLLAGASLLLKVVLKNNC